MLSLRHQGDLADTLRAAGLDVRPLPRSDDPTPAAVRRAIAERAGPMLFPGLAGSWPARTAWTPENLARAHGHKLVTALMDLPASGVLFPQDQKDYERTMPFAEFVAAMLAAPADSPCYLAYTRAAELFPASDYDFEPLTGRQPYGTDTRVWIGSAGTRSMLHSDLKDNFFCQIWGDKHVVLVPWKHARDVYPFPDNLVNSQVDLANPDLDRFPRLRRAVFYAGTVRPGDVLFMPRGCWHDIRSLTPSVSLNHWFGRPLGAADYAALLLRSGPRSWAATARDFVRYGLLRRRERTVFFFSPPSTGKRLYDLLRWGDFSRENDPAAD
ncbi:cupin-like domain-containing protein [Thermoactinospora rubra]|uniref:cupin-like domain-containing protein n=1 Tax=Thermoactinospora rubra TaxID=1088767 RepID=UPI000A103ECE|nr:cupin-like domain-containing protein [Thermoactinospora rubra]